MLRYYFSYPKAFVCRVSKLLGLFLAVASSSAVAGNFSVSPIRLDFDTSTKSGAVTVANEAPSELRVQLRLFEWTQDSAGNDKYAESEDLLYFPRLTTVGPNEQRVMRVGLRRAPAIMQEKSYRLFIEEIPAPPAANAPAGARLAIAIRFGTPLFIHPVKEEARGAIQSIALSPGALRIRVINTGNVHFKINSIGASAGTIFSKEVQGWYLLPGAAREYEIPVPESLCEQLGRVDVTVKTDKLQLGGALDANAAMCRS